MFDSPISTKDSLWLSNQQAKTMHVQLSRNLPACSQDTCQLALNIPASLLFQGVTAPTVSIYFLRIYKIM